MFDILINRPSWVMIGAPDLSISKVYNFSELQEILAESDRIYLDKVQSYLAFETRPEIKIDQEIQFQRELHDNSFRIKFMDHLAKIKHSELISAPIIIGFDPGRDITHELKNFREKK